MGSLPLVQPPAAAFDHGRAAMLAALSRSHRLWPAHHGALRPSLGNSRGGSRGAVVVLLGGAAGTSAALGGPDPASRVLSVVGVSKDNGDVDDLDEGDVADENNGETAAI